MAVNLRGSERGGMGEVRGQKGKEETMQLFI